MTKKRSKSQERILKSLAAGCEFYFTQCGAWGNRNLAAARQLHDEGIARLVRDNSYEVGLHRYRVVPAATTHNHQ
jgi:hypothetical protein